VRRVQDLRKTSGLEIADRIRILYHATSELAQAIQENSEYISSETLALEMNKAELDKEKSFTDSFDGEELLLKIEKVVR
jgi:isoleucyl-tRNA synthetase